VVPPASAPSVPIVALSGICFACWLIRGLRYTT
jgi:hypothetical protein